MVVKGLGNNLVEITWLDAIGVDVDGAPPCVVVFQHRETLDEIPCERPSAVRIIFTCSNCNNGGPRFYCRECYEDLKAGGIDCFYCKTPLTAIRET